MSAVHTHGARSGHSASHPIIAIASGPLAVRLLAAPSLHPADRIGLSMVCWRTDSVDLSGRALEVFGTNPNTVGTLERWPAMPPVRRQPQGALPPCTPAGVAK